MGGEKVLLLSAAAWGSMTAFTPILAHFCSQPILSMTLSRFLMGLLQGETGGFKETTTKRWSWDAFKTSGLRRRVKNGFNGPMDQQLRFRIVQNLIKAGNRNASILKK